MTAPPLPAQARDRALRPAARPRASDAPPPGARSDDHAARPPPQDGQKPVVPDPAPFRAEAQASDGQAQPKPAAPTPSSAHRLGAGGRASAARRAPADRPRKRDSGVPRDRRERFAPRIARPSPVRPRVEAANQASPTTPRPATRRGTPRHQRGTRRTLP